MTRGIWVLVVAACTGAPSTNVAVLDSDFSEAEQERSSADSWQFADGSTITSVSVRPSPLTAGRSVTVGLTLATEAGRSGGVALAVDLVAPHIVGRQVVVGGVGRPTPADVDRVSTFSQARAVGPGRLTFEVPLTRPWHPATAVVRAGLTRDGRAQPAIGGPRTESGFAMLAVAPVEPTPTTVWAERARTPPGIDGVLDDACWIEPGTALVESSRGDPIDAAIATSVRLAWDDSNLYVAAAMRDPDVWATLSEHDDHLWNEEVLEVFVFGGTARAHYLELQVSPAAVTFDARFEHYRRGDEAWTSRFRSGVAVAGTLGDRKDRDEGWTAELAIPWSELCEHTEVECPPLPRRRFRLNVFRFERPAGGPVVGQALSPPRVPDFHAPENAAIVELSP